MRPLTSLISLVLCGASVASFVGCSGASSVGGNSAGAGGHAATAGTTGSGPGSTTGAGGASPSGRVDKIDLVLMIDNSRSMADKQEILAATVPDFVSSLVNPRCLDPSGNPAAPQPAGPVDPCPAGSAREFNPIIDIHIGIVTSSLGGAGSDSCPDQDTSMESGCPMGVPNITEDDHGRLIARRNPCGSAMITTYGGDQGFLAWDPAQKLNPPGVKQVGDLNGNPGIVPALHDMILGAGQIGCGFESQNEAWYRFLADPAPFLTITAQKDANDNLVATPQGIDSSLLQQRADFLRPDSLLAIVVFSDENDASIKEFGQYFYVAQGRSLAGGIFHLPRGRAICATKPDDPCCASCGQNLPQCPVDATCNNPTLSDAEDPINLRAWDSKRRFGIEFFYQPDRYVSALTQPTVQNAAGELVPNPIFTPAPSKGPRDPARVFYQPIVGVPWQDIARTDATGKPDLVAGLDASGKAVGGFKSFAQLTTADASGKTTFDYEVGDYMDYDANGNPTYHWGRALNPLMVESVSPRTGTDPITGVALAPPSAPSGTNAVNGHEWTDPHAADLQYACIFDLPKEQWRHCSDARIVSCDCGDPSGAITNPLCENDPSDPTAGNRSLQVRAKAYPGIKHLSIAKSLGAQAVVGSICPKQVTDPTRTDFGYRPALRSLLEAMKAQLTKP